MLDTVKRLVNAPYISFGDFFQNYIMHVQDSAIEQEITFLLRNNFLSANSMLKLINQEIEAMK